MGYARSSVEEFATANKIYVNATVTFYTVVDGIRTNIKAPIYADTAGTAQLQNPQTLDSYGKFKQPVYVDVAVICRITGLGNTPDHDTGIIAVGDAAFYADQAEDAADRAEAAAASLNFPPLTPLDGKKIVMTKDDASGMEFNTLTEVFEYGSNNSEIWVRRDSTFDLTGVTDMSTVLQAAIDSLPASGGMLHLPAGQIKAGDLTFTFPKKVWLRGEGDGVTLFRPRSTLNKALLVVNGYVNFDGFGVNDDENTWNNPAFLTSVPGKPMIFIGEGGSDAPRGSEFPALSIASARGHAIHWAGGSHLDFGTINLGEIVGNGIYIDPASGGDTNHAKYHNVSMTRCFAGGFYGGNFSTNAGGVSTFLAMKFYECGNYSAYIRGPGNEGMLFVEGTNRKRLDLTREVGNDTFTTQRKFMAGLAPNMIMDNGVAAGFPSGAYVKTVNFDTGQVQMSGPASSNGTALSVSFSMPVGYAKGSVIMETNTGGNVLMIAGDAVDPARVIDNSVAGRNILTFTQPNNNTFAFDQSVFKLRIYQQERFVGDINKNLAFTTLCTVTNGSAVITPINPAVINRVRLTAPTTSPGNAAFSGTKSVSSVDTVNKTITLNTVNTVPDGVYMISFRPNARGGYLIKAFDDIIMTFTTGGTNIGVMNAYLGRGSRYIANTEAASTTLTMCMLFDDDAEGLAAGKGLWCMDRNIVPDGTTIVGTPVNNGDGTFTVTMSKAALLSRSAVTFWMYNINVIREIKPHLPVSQTNASAIANQGLRWGDTYVRANTGLLALVVDPTTLFQATETLVLPAVAALGFYQSGDLTLTGVSSATKLTPICVKATSGMFFWAQFTATNTYRIYGFNPTTGSINLGSTVFRTYAENTA